MASRPLRGSTIDELRDAIATGFHVNDPTNSDDGYKLNQRRVRALQEVDNAHFS